MDVERMHQHCLAMPGAWEDNPWGNQYPVVKVGEGEHGRIFAFLGSGAVGLKCGPTRDAADEWLQRYPADVKVMAYIGRAGWNDLLFHGEIPDDELLEAADESYRLVVSALPAQHRPDGWDAAAAPAADEPAPEEAEVDALDAEGPVGEESLGDDGDDGDDDEADDDDHADGADDDDHQDDDHQDDDHADDEDDEEGSA